MQNLFAEESMRKRGLLGAIVAAVAVLTAMFLMPMTQASAAPGDPVMTVNGCTVDLPFGYQYEAHGNPIDAGVQYLAWFYPGVTIDMLEGPSGDQTVVDTLDVDVPLDCVVEVTATCEAVTFHTTLSADWRGVLKVVYGDESGPLGEADFTSDTVTVPLDYNPFVYQVSDTEMKRSFDGEVSPDCTVEDTTDKPQKDKPAIPTVAPASGV